MSREEFERRRAENYFAEWAEVHGNLYGTPLAPIHEAMKQGQDVLFDIDVQGAAQLKLNIAEAVFVFILPPSLQILEQRLRQRGSDDEMTIDLRLNNAREEMKQAHWYDYVVINDNLDMAYDNLRAIYMSACLATSRNTHLVDAILE